MSKVLRIHFCHANARSLLTVCANCRYVYTGRQKKALFWLSDRTDDTVQEMFVLDCKLDAAAAAADAGASPVAGTDAPFLPKSPPLLLDPPFTPVPGELQALFSAANNDAVVLIYACGACGSPLFCSCDYALSSVPGRHSSGWPSFTSPVCADALRLRVLLQRTVTRDGGSAPGVFLAARGLRPEGAMVRRTRSGHCERLQHRTWREECLRDENKRSDPTVTEGYCATCGKAVCRVVTERRQGAKYVVNPTAVVAQVGGS